MLKSNFAHLKGNLQGGVEITENSLDRESRTIPISSGSHDESSNIT